VLVTVPAEAVKAAELAPPGTVTADGMERAVLLLESEIAVPKEGAAWFRVTVHVEELPEGSEAGLQVSVDNVGPEPTETVPPVAVTGIAWPTGDAPMGVVMPIGAVVALAESVMLTIAATPF